MAASATLAIPGMSPTVSLMLIFALFWLGPFAGAASRLAEELATGLRLQYRSGPRLHFAWAVVGVGMLALAVGAYLAAVVAVAANSVPAIYGYLPYIQEWGQTLAAAWKWLMPSLRWLHFLPVSWLVTALVLHVSALTVMWLAARPLRLARQQRLEAILGQLEQNQCDPDAEPRSSLRYFQ